MHVRAAGSRLGFRGTACSSTLCSRRRWPACLDPAADPYLNVDAGTMSPFEHGEVFVLDDGGEVRQEGGGGGDGGVM